MAAESLVPGPPEPAVEMIAVSINLDRPTLDWLDHVAEATGRNRSDTAREIFRRVREQTGRRPAR